MTDRLTFVELATGDYEVPTLSWVVRTTDEQRAEIERVVAQLNSDQHPDPYVADLRIATFDEFMDNIRDWVDDEEDDAPAVPAGN